MLNSGYTHKFRSFTRKNYRLLYKNPNIKHSNRSKQNPSISGMLVIFRIIRNMNIYHEVWWNNKNSNNLINVPRNFKSFWWLVNTHFHLLERTTVQRVFYQKITLKCSLNSQEFLLWIFRDIDQHRRIVNHWSSP